MPVKLAVPLAMILVLPLAAQVNVLTWQYDNTRAGANRSETTLTPVNVNSTNFGKLFSYPVDGYIYGQPLYLANVAIPGKGTHNVVFVATQHDSVYAFDADTNAGAPLWRVNFLTNGATTVPNADVGCSQIVPELGITSTSVIDPDKGTIYVVAMTKESGSYVHRLHALDLATGAEKSGSPVVIQASYPGTGEGGTTLVFAPRNYKQRPGLLLLNGTLYLAWASHCDIGRYHGWMMAYDAQTLRQTGVWNNTPNGNQGSFWHSGAAPAVDENGSIYLVAGNGTFNFNNGGSDLGEAYIKLSSNLAVQDYFAPFNFANLNQRDLDVGSSGVALLGDEAGSAAHPHLMAGGGKEGRIYLLDRDNMGKWRNATDDGQIVASSAAGAIGGLFGNPSYFNHSIYYCGSGDNLKAFSVWDAVLSSGPSSLTPNRFGTPGCLPTISANGTADAIAWVYDSSNVLRAFDARNLANELWNSSQNSSRDALGRYVKFTVPMVANGKVYAGTQDSLAVYGLLPNAPPALVVTNAASGQRNRAAPGSLLAISGTGLDGATVTLNGTVLPLMNSGSAQIAVQVPFDVTTGNAALIVNTQGGQVAQTTLAIQATAPGLYASEQGRADAWDSEGKSITSSHPARAGSEIAVLLTGLGATAEDHATASVSATVGGRAAQVVFARLWQGVPGVYEVNLILPQLARGDYPLQVTAGGVAANTAVVSVE